MADEGIMVHRSMARRCRSLSAEAKVVALEHDAARPSTACLSACSASASLRATVVPTMTVLDGGVSVDATPNLLRRNWSRANRGSAERADISTPASDTCRFLLPVPVLYEYPDS